MSRRLPGSNISNIYMASALGLLIMSDTSTGAPAPPSVTAVSVLENKLEQYLVRCGVLMNSEQRKDAWGWQLNRNDRKKRIYLDEYAAPAFAADRNTSVDPTFSGFSWERLSTLLVDEGGRPVASQLDIWSYDENPELAIYQQATQLRDVSNYNLKTDCTSLVDGASDTKFEAEGKWAIAEASAAFKLAVRYNQKKLERISVRAGRMKNPLALLFRKIATGSDLIRGSEFQYAADYWIFATDNKLTKRLLLLSEFDGMLVYTESETTKTRDRTATIEARASVVLGVASAQNDSKFRSDKQYSDSLTQSTFDVWTFEPKASDPPLQRTQEIPDASKITAAWTKLVTASVHYSTGAQIAEVNELRGAEVNIKLGPVAQRHRDRVKVDVLARPDAPSGRGAKSGQEATASAATLKISDMRRQSIDSQFVLLSFQVKPTPELIQQSQDQDEIEFTLRAQLGPSLNGKELSTDVKIRVRINKRPIVYTQNDVEPRHSGDRFAWRLPITELSESAIASLDLDPGKPVSCEESALSPYVSGILYGVSVQKDSSGGRSVFIHTKDRFSIPGGLASHCTVNLSLLVTTSLTAKPYRRTLRSQLDLKRLAVVDLSPVRIKKDEIPSLQQFLISYGAAEIRDAVVEVGETGLSEPLLRLLGISFDPLNGEWIIPREHIDLDKYKRFLEKPAPTGPSGESPL